MTEIELQQIQKMIDDTIVNVINGNQKFIFQKDIQILDLRNIQVGKTNGTKIGTETTQKIGFYGETPVVQAGAISAPTGGGGSATDAIDQAARTAINAIRAALTAIGITA